MPAAKCPPSFDLRAIYIRWGIASDLPQVCAIESASFEYAWTEGDFLWCLRRRNCICMVAERGDEIVGFMVYELRDNELALLNFAVRPDLRRQGVGALLIDKLKYKLAQHRREYLTLVVGEWNTPAQLFFRAQGFRAVGVAPRYYPNGGAGYRMELRPVL